MGCIKIKTKEMKKKNSFMNGVNLFKTADM